VSSDPARPGPSDDVPDEALGTSPQAEWLRDTFDPPPGNDAYRGPDREAAAAAVVDETLERPAVSPGVYPLPRPEQDARFTFGLVLDVRDVLARHGYPSIVSGADLVGLQQALFGFLYVDLAFDIRGGRQADVLLGRAEPPAEPSPEEVGEAMREYLDVVDEDVARATDADVEPGMQRTLAEEALREQVAAKLLRWFVVPGGPAAAEHVDRQTLMANADELVAMVREFGAGWDLVTEAFDAALNHLGPPPAVAQPRQPGATIRAAAERYASRMRAAGMEVTVTEPAPGQITISGRDPNAPEEPEYHGGEYEPR
jgi:hypothetical protein